MEPTGGFPRPLSNEVDASHGAFLCDNDGQIISDIAEPLLGSDRSISARSLVSLSGPSIAAFFQAVRARGVLMGWETRIHSARSASKLVLHGCQTPFGILVFATVTPRQKIVPGDRPEPSATLLNSGIGRDEEATAKLLSESIHDLKNPVSSIVSSCEYLTAYSVENLNPEQLEMFTEIESAAWTLLQLSERIAELSSRFSHSRNAESASS